MPELLTQETFPYIFKSSVSLLKFNQKKTSLGRSFLNLTLSFTLVRNGINFVFKFMTVSPLHYKPISISRLKCPRMFTVIYLRIVQAFKISFFYAK